jgi:serine phosphatase RsbU (regulator of sigma subunit)
MDMAAIEIERQNEKKILRYSGAHNPLYYIRDNQLNELAPIKYSIGSIPPEQKNNILCHTVEMKKDDIVYLFSDGYADQLSGETGKKFMKGKFKQLLLDIHKKPLHEQKNILEETNKTWRGDTFQTDDMLVMGFRF